LKIVVCVKQVPDSAAKVIAENGRITWGDAPLVINPWDEYAVETALKLQESHAADVIAISVGDQSAREALKHALAMGCKEAILVSDPAIQKADSQATARILAAAISKISEGEGAGLVFFGRQAIDGDMGVTHAQTARALGWPALTLVSQIDNLDTEAGTIVVQRSTEEGRQIVEGKLPVVVSVGKDIGEPRYPSFMGIRKASRAVIPTWSLDELGIEAPQVHVDWSDVINPPVREVKCELISGGSVEEIAETLADKILEEKVL
jgi:electron transfer flavoprotein beta subunit